MMCYAGQKSGCQSPDKLKGNPRTAAPNESKSVTVLQESTLAFPRRAKRNSSTGEQEKVGR
jgi:hypothetical protein